MVGSKKSVTHKSARSSTKEKSQDPAEKMRKLHQSNLSNAQAFIGHMKNTFMETEVDRSLIAILKVIRHWPALIADTGPDAFVPEFSATRISAEEAEEGADFITTVSFSYSGRSYRFVSRTINFAAGDYTFGNISLYQNDSRLISMGTGQDHIDDQIDFRELNSFSNVGTWIDDMICIEKEIAKFKEETP